MAETKQQPQPDILRFTDGSTIELTRMPEVDDNTWEEVKEYLQKNPEVATSLKSFAGNPEAIRGWLQTQAISNYYNAKIANEDAEVQNRLDVLQQDPELAPIFDCIKTQGLEAALKYCNDEDLMLKISNKMGGVPADLQPELLNIESMPVSLHEACKTGNMEAVRGYLDKQVQSVDCRDIKGITPLGYAVGGSYAEIVKLLVETRADPRSVDSNDNSALHYAAGYGRKELVEFLLGAGVDANKANLQGQTPLKVASMNKQATTMQLLEQHGGCMS